MNSTATQPNSHGNKNSQNQLQATGICHPEGIWFAEGADELIHRRLLQNLPVVVL